MRGIGEGDGLKLRIVVGTAASCAFQVAPPSLVARMAGPATPALSIASPAAQPCAASLKVTEFSAALLLALLASCAFQVAPPSLVARMTGPLNGPLLGPIPTAQPCAASAKVTEVSHAPLPALLASCALQVAPPSLVARMTGAGGAPH